MKIILFKKYPKLEKYCSYISLGLLPTPITKINKLNGQFKLNDVYIKRDDLSGGIYGGNKVRKLEFIFADAKRLRKKTVITFGLTGSNHVLATTIYAKQLNLNCIGMLLPQRNSRHLKKTILGDIYYNGEIHEYRNKIFLALGLLYIIIQRLFKEKSWPYIIPPGGSSKLGILGYVNAAFELNEQIRDGLMPKPDIVYVPMGSSGTAAGLILGFKLLCLNIKVCGVRASDEQYANKNKLIGLIKKTNIFIHKIDNDIPIVNVSRDDYMINNNHFGQGYGIFTNEAISAMNLLYNKENIILDGVYTGKTFAAICNDLSTNKINDKVILFWNTYNSKELPILNEALMRSSLPKELMKYYREPVQELDNKIICDSREED